ncbi:hypothetical protein BU17DRAFT_62294 [Hysterangium stoloniferum]|nr:hypothetical protein BU17DRAFT_62294 [Hysterangium stoloniferum]
MSSFTNRDQLPQNILICIGGAITAVSAGMQLYDKFMSLKTRAAEYQELKSIYARLKVAENMRAIDDQERKMIKEKLDGIYVSLRHETTHEFLTLASYLKDSVKSLLMISPAPHATGRDQDYQDRYSHGRGDYRADDDYAYENTSERYGYTNYDSGPSYSSRRLIIIVVIITAVDVYFSGAISSPKCWVPSVAQLQISRWSELALFAKYASRGGNAQQHKTFAVYD